MATPMPARDAGGMSAPRPIRRPHEMRIDPLRCQRGDLCRLLAPEVGDGRHVPVTPDTLAAMAACPTGALGWREEDPPRGD